MNGTCSTQGKMLCRILVGGGSGGRRELRRPVCRWEDNVKWMLNEDDGRARIGFILYGWTGTSGGILCTR